MHRNRIICITAVARMGGLVLGMLLSGPALGGATGEPLGAERAGPDKPKEWPEGKTYQLKGLKVNLSAPVLVARHNPQDRVLWWYAYMYRVPSGEVMAIITTGPDQYENWSKCNTGFCWSADGGLTWSEPKFYKDCPCGYPGPTLPSGDQVMLPFLFYKSPDGPGGARLTSNYYLVSKDKREIKVMDEKAVEMSAWPFPPGEYMQYTKNKPYAGFVLTGRALKLKDQKTWMAPLYGMFKDEQECSLVAAESEDGFKWKIRALIAGKKVEDSPVVAAAEPDLCRLKDGRILCVYGHDAYGMAYSSDEGKTWTRPVRMPGPGGIEPRLAVLEDGTVIQAAGPTRGGLSISLNGAFTDRQVVPIYDHHNEFRPQEPFNRKGTLYNGGCGAGVVALDDRHFLYLYDRIPGSEPPEDHDCCYWVVRATVEKTAP